ncbi:MAG: cytochrome c oxidase subunit 3 [Pirellulales bacterium]
MATSAAHAAEPRPRAGGGSQPPAPPRDGNGWGNGDNGSQHPPFRRRTNLPISNRKLALAILICSLTMLFTGLMSAYAVLRASAGRYWPPEGIPALPSGLWLSTLVIVASSAALVWAHQSVRRDKRSAMKAGLVLTTLLGAAFLAVQVYLWRDLFVRGLTQASLYGGLFYVLSGTHAAHVLGGMVILGCVSVRGLANRYTPQSHEGIELASMYWHFLAVVWIVLFAVLYVVH